MSISSITFAETVYQPFLGESSIFTGNERELG
jgi:hypothetical protein